MHSRWQPILASIPTHFVGGHSPSADHALRAGSPLHVQTPPHARRLRTIELSLIGAMCGYEGYELEPANALEWHADGMRSSSVLGQMDGLFSNRSPAACLSTNASTAKPFLQLQRAPVKMHTRGAMSAAEPRLTSIADDGCCVPHRPAKRAARATEGVPQLTVESGHAYPLAAASYRAASIERCARFNVSTPTCRALIHAAPPAFTHPHSSDAARQAQPRCLAPSTFNACDAAYLDATHLDAADPRFVEPDPVNTMHRPLQPPRTAPQPIDLDWRIPMADVVFKRRVGIGASGTTYLADWKGVPVAVKVAGSGAARLAEWRAEATSLMRLRHPNVIQVRDPPKRILCLHSLH